MNVLEPRIQKGSR